MSRLFLWVCIAIGAAVGATTPARADDTRRLGATSPWYLSYAEDSCRIVRQFGEGDEQITLILDRYEPGHLFRLTLAGRPFRHVDSGRDARLRFGDYEAEQRRPFKRGMLGDIPAMIFATAMTIDPAVQEAVIADSSDGSEALDPLLGSTSRNRISSERYRNARYLRVNARRMSPVRLETGPMENLFSAFDTCLDELLTHWGVDAEAHRSLRSAAVPLSLHRWIDPADYPRRALWRGEQALVYFRLGVDAQGDATDCHIQGSTGGDHFQEAVCEALMENAEFNPAVDAAGNPIASYFVSSVLFTMER